MPNLVVVIPDLIRDPAPPMHWIADQVRNDKSWRWYFCNFDLP